MGFFTTKKWKARLVEHAGRRKLTNVDTGAVMTVDVERAEGYPSQIGDAINPTNLDDLESRVNDGFESVENAIENDLLGTDAKKFLAAPQGKVLDEKITKINSNLGTLSFAQSTDGKWGYKVAGADPVIPFKHYYDLGIGVSFDVSSFTGYQGFTVDNFVVEPVNKTSNFTGSQNLIGASCTAYVTKNKAYNAGTGILTASVTGGVTPPGSTTTTVHAYLIP